ncbi:hypothetical protein RA086_05485 [Lactiplantibacillus sp. WILCCON 0030]|uniref:DUF2187 domain-containing protein n=1 Tax=Lactiplantibacillus brownii TaxID=3069269 RepID=A0ABU1A818_9LACO|nr:hypothetical protein [Lactiplantibacillus brownii]MDQ7937079.1 hypothetical protein [Lactiplantibacillus brownii]
MKIIDKQKTNIEFGDVVQDEGGYYLVVSLDGDYALVELERFTVLGNVPEANPNNLKVYKVPSVLTIG